jgi:hypothetical protein
MAKEKREKGHVPEGHAQSNGITPTNIYVRPQKKPEGN